MLLGGPVFLLLVGSRFRFPGRRLVGARPRIASASAGAPVAISVAAFVPLSKGCAHHDQAAEQ